MGRNKEPEIRERLLEACTDFVLETGMPDKLQTLATASGTSARMLLYHFGTRQQLLQEVLRRARRRQREDFEQLLRAREGEDYRTTLTNAWVGIVGATGQRYLNIFDRLREDQRQQLWPGFRREATTDWLVPLEDGLRTIGRPELATLVLAVMRGLIMDMSATGDRPRADRAFAQFMTSLQ